MTFAGFPVAALDFYDDLEMDNTKSYWEAPKAIYTEAVKALMVALTDALEPEFGKPKVFRPFRDVRFAKEKSNSKSDSRAPAPATERLAGRSRLDRLSKMKTLDQIRVGRQSRHLGQRLP